MAKAHSKSNYNPHRYSCPTGWTTCCSEWGWCGDSAEHCGTGCQSAYGSCSGGTNPGNPGTPGGSVPFGQWIYSCTVPGKFALSFDDGPYEYVIFHGYPRYISNNYSASPPTFSTSCLDAVSRLLSSSTARTGAPRSLIPPKLPLFRGW